MKILLFLLLASIVYSHDIFKIPHGRDSFLHHFDTTFQTTSSGGPSLKTQPINACTEKDVITWVNEGGDFKNDNMPGTKYCKPNMTCIVDPNDSSKKICKQYIDDKQRDCGGNNPCDMLRYFR